MSMGGQVVIPYGVSVSPGRETTQIGPNNQNVSGMSFTLTLPNTSTTSVFVPYAVMTNTDLVSQMFADRVNAINGVTSLGG